MKKLLLLIFLSFLLGCSEKEDKPLLATSIYPLTWVAKNLFPHYGVYQIIKKGSNPHLYDLTPKDALKVEQAKRVFLVGNLEPFAQRVPQEKRLEVIKVLNLPESVNPHLWLSPKRWLEFVQNLPPYVKELHPDPEGYNRTIEKLKGLDREYRKLEKENLAVVMVHPAFVWLCKDYNLEILTILEPGEGIGISPKRLEEALQKLKTLKGKRALILYVSVNPREQEVAQKLSSKSGIAAVGLDPALWGNKEDYIQIMERNLKLILKALRR